MGNLKKACVLDYKFNKRSCVLVRITTSSLKLKFVKKIKKLRPLKFLNHS